MRRRTLIVNPIKCSLCIVFLLNLLTRLRQPRAAFLLNRAITRSATITKTFGQPYPSYMKSFIKIRGAVLEKSDHKTMALYNFNKDCDFKNTERVKNCNSVSLRILPLS